MDYTWEINTKDFQFGTQRGYITLADIDAFVGELISTYGCTATHPTKDTWYLNDLSFTDYEDLERNYWKEVGYYISAKSEKAKKSVNSSKHTKKLNSSTKMLADQALLAIQEYKNIQSHTIPHIEESISWLSVELEYYLDNLIDDSRAEHVQNCINKLLVASKQLQEFDVDLDAFITKLERKAGVINDKV